jgi:hypothetical protein
MDTKSILIVSSIRCGGTYLMKDLAKSYNCRTVFEPKELKVYNYPVVVKANAAMHTVEDLAEYSKHFIHVILLDRGNKEEQIQSAAHMFSTRSSNVKWTPTTIDKKMIEKATTDITAHSEVLNKLSSKLGIKIKYYEDVYFNNKNLVDGIEFFPDLTKKLRQEEVRKSIH